MKYILTIILILLFFAASAQTKTLINPPTGNKNSIMHFTDALGADSAFALPGLCGTPDTSYFHKYSTKYRRAYITVDTCSSTAYLFNPNTDLVTVLGGGESSLTAGPFTTSNTEVGYDPGSNLTAAQIIAKVWYGLKPPTATLTGGSTLEYANAGFDCTLSWSAHRQNNTATLSSIVVAGITQSFSQPGQPGTVNGTQDVTVPANTNTTYSNVVTASDGQADTATTSFSWAPRKYYGWISDTTGIGSGSQDAAIRALTSVLSTSKNLSTNTGSPSGTQFYVYAYYSGLGTITSITFNGIPATDAITTISKSFTTANGFSGTYKILYTTNGQTTSSDVIYQ
jgi:hypothetical protein